MNDSGIYTIETIFLSIVALWFARQLKCFVLLNNINDPQRVLPPTIVLFLGLLIIPYVYHDISGDSGILEIFKSNTPLTAIAIFLIGQYTAKREKRKEKEEEEKVAGKRILYLLQEFIESDALSEIEGSLNISNPDYNLDKFKEVSEQQKEYFSHKLQEIKTDQSIFNSSYRENLITYLRRVEKIFKEENQAGNDFTLTVWLFYFHKHKAYEHKLHLCKNKIKDNALLQSNLSSLEFERKKLARGKERKGQLIKNYIELSSRHISEEESERLKYLEKKHPYLPECLSYYECIEEDLISNIDKIINDYR